MQADDGASLRGGSGAKVFDRSHAEMYVCSGASLFNRR